MNERFFRQLFPSLADFLGATFHAAWVIEYPDAQSAVSGFVARNRAVVAERILTDLLRLRETELNESDLGELLVEVGCAYDYSLDGETARGWLSKIESLLRSWPAGS